MITLLKSISSLFTVSAPVRPTVEDPTIYQVETSFHKYCGRIIYQDEVMIQLKSFKPKAIKILKANINKITVVKTESAQQYYQWHSKRLAGIGN